MTAREAAQEEFRRLERDHHPEVVSDDVHAELDRLAAAADALAERLG